MRLAAKWVRQRCHPAPGRVAPTASTRPGWASEVTSRTPVRPQATRSGEERQPARTVLGGVDLQAQDLPIPLGVDTGSDQGRDLDHPAALADLHRQRVGGDERVRPGVQRVGAERLDLRVEVLRHRRDLRLRQPRDAQRGHQLLQPPSGHPEQVGGGHDRHQRGCPTAGPGGRCADPPAPRCARRRPRRTPRRPAPTSAPRGTCAACRTTDPGSPRPAAGQGNRTGQSWDLRLSWCSSSEIHLPGSLRITRWPHPSAAPRRTFPPYTNPLDSTSPDGR